MVDHEPNKYNHETDHIDCNLIASVYMFHMFTEADHITYLEWIRYEKKHNGIRHPNFLPTLFNKWDNYNWEKGTFRPTDFLDQNYPNNSPDQVLTDLDVEELLNVILNQENGEGNPYLELVTNQGDDMCTDGVKAFHKELKKSTNSAGDTTKLGELLSCWPCPKLVIGGVK